MNILCTICSDIVSQTEEIYATKCGHIFHHHCLIQWIERSKTCPQCRHKVTDKCMYRLYPTAAEGGAEGPAELRSRLDDALLKLRQLGADCSRERDKVEKLTAQIDDQLSVVKAYEKKLVSRESTISALRDQLEYVKIQNTEVNKLKADNEELKKRLDMLQGLQVVLNASTEQVEQILTGTVDIRSMAVFATALKSALKVTESKKQKFYERMQAAQSELAAERTLTAQLQEKLAIAKQKCESLKRKASASIERAAEEARPCSEHSGHSTQRPGSAGDLDTTRDAFNDALHVSIDSIENTSVGSLVRRIEGADSPYLRLKQGAPLAHNLHTDRLKPSEFGILNSVKNTAKRSGDENQHSIFHKKQAIAVQLKDKSEHPSVHTSGVSYDGLGGHSKVDTFPVPIPRPVLKSCVPKVTARHKLKRPNTTNHSSQDIGKVFENIFEKSLRS